MPQNTSTNEEFALIPEEADLGAELFDHHDLLRLISQYLEGQDLYRFILARSDVFEAITTDNPQVVIMMFDHLQEKINRDYNKIWLALNKNMHTFRELIPYSLRQAQTFNEFSWIVLQSSSLGFLGPALTSLNILDALIYGLPSSKLRVPFIDTRLRISSDQETVNEYNRLKAYYQDIINLPELSVFLEPYDVTNSFSQTNALNVYTKELVKEIDKKIERLKKTNTIEDKNRLSNEINTAKLNLQENIQEQTYIIHTLFFRKSNQAQNDQQNLNPAHRM